MTEGAEVRDVMMWTVLEDKTKAKKVLDKAPKHIQEKYDFWKQIVERDGPKGVKDFSGFRDHSLKGEWKGFRSSYLNDQYRVIYTIDRQKVAVFVKKVGPHNY